jgi:hypothetical protein
MTTRIPLPCIAGLAALALAAPAHAAKPKPLYELQLSGSEAVAWHYKAPPEGCFYGAEGNGAQEVSYGTGKIKVKVVKSKEPGKKGLLQIAALKDKIADYGYAQPIPAVVRAERDGEIDSSAGCGGTGHSTQQPPPKDCGIRYGRVQLRVGYHALTAFSVDGHYDNFGTPAPGETDDIVHPLVPPTDGLPLGQVYQNCDFILPSQLAPANDDLTTVSKRLSTARLPKKGKTLKISGGDQDEATSDDGERSAQTSIAWNLKLKRVR